MEVDQEGVQETLADLEQRVDAAEPLGRCRQTAAAVAFFHLLAFQHPGAVGGPHHLPLPVQLQQVAADPVEHQPADREIGIEGPFQQGFRVAALLHQQPGGMAEGQLVDFRRTIVRERVVHVETPPEMPVSFRFRLQNTRAGRGIPCPDACDEIVERDQGGAGMRRALRFAMRTLDRDPVTLWGDSGNSWLRVARRSSASTKAWERSAERSAASAESRSS